MQRLVMSDAARDNEQTHSWACGPTQDAVELSKALQVLPMPRTVLVVDDERDANDILANLVRPQGFVPIQVFSGQQALAAVADHSPDLVLLDLMLPDIDGFEVCDQLKRNRKTNLIPIVMVTALQDAHHRAAGVRVGANGYLIKPFTPAQLHTIIKEAIAWHDEHLERGTTGEIQFDIRSELNYLAQAN